MLRRLNIFLAKAENRKIIYSVIILFYTIIYPNYAHASIFSWFASKEKEKTTDIVKHIYTVSFTINGDKEYEDFIKSYSTLLNNTEKNTDSSVNLILAARSDYKNLLTALYNKAYYGGYISIKLNDTEVSDLDITTELPYNNHIKIYVDPHKQFTFEQTKISPLPSPMKKNDPYNFNKIGYIDGNIALSPIIINAGQHIVELWKKRGYPTAHIKETNIVAYHPNNTISSAIVIEPGDVGYYGDINLNWLKGDANIDNDYLLWMLNLPKGKIYNPDEIRQAQERLSRLEYIQGVKIVPADKISPNGYLPLEVYLQNHSKYNLTLGAIYSNIDGANLEVNLLNRNLMGRSESLKLSARIGGLIATTAVIDLPPNMKHTFNHSFSASFLRPGTITPNSDFGIFLTKNRSVLNNYLQNIWMLKLFFSHQFSKKLSATVTSYNTKAKTYDNYFRERNFLWTGIQTQLTFDNRDIPTDASHGFYLAANIFPFYNISNSSLAIKATLETRGYLSLNKTNSIIIAGKAMLGSILNAKVKDIPPDMIFYTGGGDTIRGYAYRSIGIDVKDREGKPVTIGGRSLILGSLELRANFNSSFGGVIFSDIGYVGENAWFASGEKFKMSLGLGLRYNTAVGPLRLDIATPLRRTKNDPYFGVYIGIGQAF
ncbi:autotransporter assembly complex family protein [Bartonella sp. DGB1]|uniref:autotransporter assembly complex protein TamA n=1 Tax=Bartonella sp. DGB1 TaxID=3239807 RepID=UPI003526C159